MPAPTASAPSPIAVMPPSGSPAAATAECAITLAVSGMTCAACVARIEKLLGRKNGILSASVSLPAERAQVTFDPDRIALTEVVAVIENAGFGAVPLQPDQVASPADHAAEAQQTLRLLALAALLTLPLTLDMVAMLAGWPLHVPGWLQWLLATPVQFGVGWRFYRGAWHALKGGGANMDVLVALGTSAAYGLSVYKVLSGAHGHLDFEASAVVITLVIAGKWLEARARRATNQAVDVLMALRPDTARRLRADGREEMVPVEQVVTGDVVVLRPGERVPVDGVVIAGRAALDESMVTGESLPRERGTGDAVTGGTLNLDGLLQVRATAVGAAAMLGRMVTLVGQAQATKPRLQRLADTVSGYFAFFVASVALLTFSGWWLAGASLEAAVLPAVAVLVVACPCALGLATPAVIAVALGTAARHGILIRDAEALEKAFAVRRVVFDKTGTLTEDRPEIVEWQVLQGTPAAQLQRAAAVQHASQHPIARAFRDRAQAEGLDLPAVDDFRAMPGRGVIGTVAGETLWLGNAAMMAEYAVDTAPGGAQATAWEAAGRAVVWIASTTTASESGQPLSPPRLVGLVAIADRPRDTATAAIARLKALGVTPMMLTGDAPAAAAAMAARLGLTEVLAGVTPEGKIAEIRRLHGTGQVVAMVGDGVNDAPALAQADLGIAMGSAMDVATAAAGVSLMRDDPRLVAATIELARATRRKIVQNLVWAFAFNALAIPLAALGHVPPVLAALGMTFSSLTVVGNALSLRRWRDGCEVE